MTDDCRGFALVCEFELESGLNYLAEVPQLKVIVWDAFDYNAIPPFAVREKDCDCSVTIRGSVAWDEGQTFFAKTALEFAQRIRSPEDHFLVTFDGVGEFAPIKLPHAVICVFVVKVIVALSSQADVTPLFSGRTRRVVQGDTWSFQMFSTTVVR